MFVGDVRCATTALGVSWKLSGGKSWSSGVTNVAKYRHVRRAINRSVAASASVSGSVVAVARGKLIQRATAGAAAHSRRKGIAAGQACGRPHTTRDGRGDGERGAAGHPAVEALEIEPEPGLGLRRRHPFQEPASRPVHAQRASARSRRSSARPGTPAS